MSRKLYSVMRTTIRMRSELAKRVKAYAKKTDRTFTELVEEALVDLLERGNGFTPSLPPLTVVGGDRPVSDQELKRSIEEMDFEDDHQRLGITSDSTT